jgi:hypothetical protein
MAATIIRLILIDEGKELSMEICWGERVEEAFGEVERGEMKNDRRLPPETAAMPKADTFHSLTR